MSSEKNQEDSTMNKLEIFLENLRKISEHLIVPLMYAGQCRGLSALLKNAGFDVEPYELFNPKTELYEHGFIKWNEDGCFYDILGKFDPYNFKNYQGDSLEIKPGRFENILEGLDKRILVSAAEVTTEQIVSSYPNVTDPAYKSPKHYWFNRIIKMYYDAERREFQEHSMKTNESCKKTWFYNPQLHPKFDSTRKYLQCNVLVHNITEVFGAIRYFRNEFDLQQDCLCFVVNAKEELFHQVQGLYKYFSEFSELYTQGSGWMFAQYDYWKMENFDFANHEKCKIIPVEMNSNQFWLDDSGNIIRETEVYLNVVIEEYCPEISE